MKEIFYANNLVGVKPFLYGYTQYGIPLWTKMGKKTKMSERRKKSPGGETNQNI